MILLLLTLWSPETLFFLWKGKWVHMVKEPISDLISLKVQSPSVKRKLFLTFPIKNSLGRNSDSSHLCEVPTPCLVRSD